MSFGELGSVPLDHTLAFCFFFDRTVFVTFHTHLLTNAVGRVSSQSAAGCQATIPSIFSLSGVFLSAVSLPEVDIARLLDALLSRLENARMNVQYAVKISPSLFLIL